jgi:hypothetical protein
MVPVAFPARTRQRIRPHMHQRTVWSLSQSCTGGIGSETSRIRHHVVNLAIAGASGAAESLFPSCWLTVSVFPPWFITEPVYETTGRFAW